MFTFLTVLSIISIIVCFPLFPVLGPVPAICAIIGCIISAVVFAKLGAMEEAIKDLEKKCDLYEFQIKDLKEKTQKQDKNEDGK